MSFPRKRESNFYYATNLNLGNIQLMHLWTWQKSSVSLTSGEYDALKYSDYVNDLCIKKSERDRFEKAYRKIWKLLGKDKTEKIKILWCYTDEQEAKKARASNKNKVLWKIDVPAGNIRYICNVAWHWILYGKDGAPCLPPENLFQFYHALTKNSMNQFNKDFNTEWRKMTEDALWNILFRDNLVEGCTTAIVIHPVKKTWYKERFGFDDV
jgi:hypothetical protein